MHLMENTVTTAIIIANNWIKTLFINCVPAVEWMVTKVDLGAISC